MKSYTEASLSEPLQETDISYAIVVRTVDRMMPDSELQTASEGVWVFSDLTKGIAQSIGIDTSTGSVMVVYLPGRI